VPSMAVRLLLGSIATTLSSCYESLDERRSPQLHAHLTCCCLKHALLCWCSTLRLSLFAAVMTYIIVAVTPGATSAHAP
jgi:hypothetical protein